MNGPDLVFRKPSTEEDRFYEKLFKLNESSALSLLFNFRQTNLHLFKFYKQVTRQGGYHQVTKDRKWGEIASSVNTESSSLLPDQLQKIYESLLSPFEQIHHYRSTPKEAAPSVIGFDAEHLSSGKVKYPFRSIVLNSNEPSSGVNSVDKIVPRNTIVKDKDTNLVQKTSRKPRTAYQLFISKEYERLREMDKESSESHIRGLAIKAWRQLPEKKRKPYVDESNEEKKRIAQQQGIIIKSICEKF